MKRFLGELIFQRSVVKSQKHLPPWGDWNRFAPQGILVSIYESSVLSHLDYCSDVWGNIGAGLSQRLEKLQNTSARIITGTGWDVRSPQILRDLDPNIYQRNLPTPIPFTDIIWGLRTHGDRQAIYYAKISNIDVALCGERTKVLRSSKWLEHPPGVLAVIGSNPVGDSDFFFILPLWHADNFIFTFVSPSLKFTIFQSFTMARHCFLRPIRKDLTSSSYTTWALVESRISHAGFHVFPSLRHLACILIFEIEVVTHNLFVNRNALFETKRNLLCLQLLKLPFPNVPYDRLLKCLIVFL